MADKIYPQENFLTFEGNLGEDPELKYWESGDPYCMFDIANNDDFLNKDDEKIKRTNWSPILTTGKLAEAVAEFMKKGSHVMVFGKLVQRKWQNEAGENRSRLQIRAFRVKFMDRKNGNGGGREEPPDMEDGEIPF